MKNGKFFKSAFGLYLVILLVMSASSVFAKNEVIELSLGHATPPFTPEAQVIKQYAQKINEQSQGRIKINIYFGGSLVGGNEVFRAVQKGIVDINFYVVGNDWGLTPLNMFSHVVMGFPDTKSGTEILHKVWDKFPALKQELESLGLTSVAMKMRPSYQLHFTKKDVRVPADMKGLKIIPLSGYMAERVMILGASPVDKKIDEMYMSLERGMVDGVILNFEAMAVFKVMDLLTHHTVIPGGLGMPQEYYLINLKKWNSIPPDLQKVFEEVAPWFEQETLKANDMVQNGVIQHIKESGQSFIEPSPEEIRLWKDALKPLQEKWIKDMEAKGLPGKAIFDETTKLIAEYSK